MAFTHAGVEYYLQEDVAQLIRQVIGLFLVDGSCGLVGLLQQKLAQALVGLFPIPGTAVFASQQCHDLQQIVEAEAVALIKGRSGNIHGAGVVVAMLPIQFHQLDGYGPAVRLHPGWEEHHVGLLVVQVAKPQLHFARQHGRVQLGNQQGQAGIVPCGGAGCGGQGAQTVYAGSGVGKLAEIHIRHGQSRQQRQRAVLGALRRQFRNRAVAGGVHDRVGDGAALRLLPQMAGDGAVQRVEIIVAVIPGIQGIIGNAVFLKPGRHAMAACAKDQPPGLLKGLNGLHRHQLRAAGAKGYNGDHGFHW